MLTFPKPQRCGYLCYSYYDFQHRDYAAPFFNQRWGFDKMQSCFIFAVGHRRKINEEAQFNKEINKS